uniref:NADH-ubiquinone oxidoreductase chain 2 n=1 Tax=Coleoptera sp. 14 KM-2017 TaxID=2219317 RepID=A0A346RGI8_9COLE|nr:NADH dehydrogenase subunit 2 [Coleoptera sp. 14 KM-2017]
MKKYNLMFLSTMILGTLISISSYSWMGMWMGLEINLISIIPLLSQKTEIYSSEASIKYFITQALASAILMYVIIMFSLYHELLTLSLKKSMIMMINSSLLTKMGAAPFHFWFPEVMEGLSWMNCFIMLTWQKIAPMVLLMYNSNFSLFMTMIIVISMMVSGLVGFNQVSMRKIMAYSSINHIGWMIAALMYSQTIWMIYFMVYTIISANIIILLKTAKIFFFKQILMLNLSPLMKTMFMLNFFSLGGLPPFLGFMPKWFTIQMMIENNQLFLAFSMIILTLITLFFYVRITLSSLVLTQINPITKNEVPNLLVMSTNIMALMGLLMIPLTFNLF